MQTRYIDEVNWADGFHARIKARDAFDEIERLREANDGHLTPQIICKSAKDTSSPLHPQVYHLKQGKAAARWYEQEARVMLGAIRVKYTEAPNIEARAYQVVVRPDTDQAATKPKVVRSYTSTREALADPVYRAQAITEALQSLLRAKAKYAALAELAPIFQAIDAVAARYGSS